MSGWIVRSVGAGLVVALGSGGFLGLWLTPDQQGRRLLESGENAAAAERFEDSMWRGIALYRAGDPAAAALEFARLDTAEGWYNLGLASVDQGQLEVALEAFEQALERSPGFEDAAFNRDLIAHLIEAEKESEGDESPTQDPHFSADEMVIDDEKSERGQEGEIEMTLLSDEALDAMWLQQIPTTPADFLRRKFAVQAAEEER